MSVFRFSIDVADVTEEQAKTLARMAQRYVIDCQEHDHEPGYVVGVNADDTVVPVP